MTLRASGWKVEGRGADVRATSGENTIALLATDPTTVRVTIVGHDATETVDVPVVVLANFVHRVRGSEALTPRAAALNATRALVADARSSVYAQFTEDGERVITTLCTAMDRLVDAIEAEP